MRLLLFKALNAIVVNATEVHIRYEHDTGGPTSEVMPFVIGAVMHSMMMRADSEVCQAASLLSRFYTSILCRLAVAG